MIPLARPVLGEDEERRVAEVLRSGQLSLGPVVPAFERAFAQRLGATHASAVSSGTAGLHLALRAVGVSDGDEVVTTPFSFVASANVAVYERARPVFADIDPVTLNLDPAAAAAAVTDRTAAILPVHIFGYPADLPAFERLGVPIVEDACEALGAVHGDGIAVGARGHPAVFGFYANKQLTTGEGGIVTLADGALKERIDSERNQGRAPDMGWLDHDRLGFNYRLTDIACAIGLAQLERLDELLAGRARVAAGYREALAPLSEEHGLELPCPDAHGNVRGWFVFVVQLPDGGPARDDVVRALRERGVQSKPYLPAIHLMTYYRETFGHRPGEFPICESVAARSLALPFFPAMTEAQVERVSGALAEVFALNSLPSGS
jgi:perosamine synthetase